MARRLRKVFGIVALDHLNQEFVVAFNMGKEEMVRRWGRLKQNAKGRAGLEAFRDAPDPEGAGLFACHGGVGAILIREFDGSWESYDVLLHECAHAVDWLIGKSAAEGEMELRAYTLVGMFRSCRRMVQGLEPRRTFDRYGRG